MNIVSNRQPPTLSTLNGDNETELQCTFHEWSHLDDQPGFFRIFTIISVLTVIVVLVVLGNALVIAAVILRRRLRSATGLLILSLAVADLMVGLVILPFSIANEALNRYWIFGDTWCTMWLTMDIWMCTASIYNLVAISIDRYIAIIKPLNYPMLVTKFRARCIVAAVWIGSFIICSPSFLLASTDTSKPKDCKCTPANSGIAYIIFSASSSFYIPMIIVIFVYVRIYIAACAATKSVYSGMMQVTATANKNPKNVLMQNPSALSRSENMPMLRVHRGSSVAVKNSSLSTQIDSTRSRTNVVPIPQNGGCSPTVYAQMNGSSTSLQYAKNGSRSPRISTRRHSEDQKMKEAEAEQNGNCNSPRRSTGSIQMALSEEEEKAPPKGKGTSLMGSKTPPASSERRKPLNHQYSTTSEPGSKQRHLSGSNKTMEKIKEQLSLELAEANSPHNKTTPNSKSETHLKNLEAATVIPNPGATMNNTYLGPKPTVPFQNNNTNHVNNNNNSYNNKVLLHPNDVPTKKKSYGANMINKIMRRGPRKRAGCAYEKRLSLEIKAAKTVAIVTGCFIFCWLGFSILYGFNIETNEVVWSIVFWLGYLNSALNPVIYTVFNREFRTCFKRLLTCNHLLFSSQSTTQQTTYNSYNSQMRPGKVVGYSSVSAAPYYSRSSPPLPQQSQSSNND